jgi:hemolysin III
MPVPTTPATEHYPSDAERRADAWVHGVGLAAAVIGGATLVALSAQGGSPGRLAAVAVFAIGLVLMLLSSTAYNLARSPQRRRTLRRVDHAAIFLLIACSYTPFTTQCLEGQWALGMTLAVWAVALAGIAVKLVVHDPPKGLSLAAYLAAGWMAVIAIGPLIERVPTTALLLLGLGGLLYSVGASIYAMPRIRFRRAIWHGFVVAAAGTHWSAVLIGVVARPA